MSFSFKSLRFCLILLVLLAVVPGLALTWYSASEQRRSAARDVADDVRRMARLASAGQRQLVEGAHQLLQMLSQLPEVRGADPSACNALLAGLLKQYPLYATFGVIETNGEVFASGVTSPRGVNLSDRPYFRGALETHDFAAGDYQIGRITGKPTLNFGYPVFEQGKVHRVVYAALNLSWLEKMASEAELPRGAVLFVIDRHGTALARWPEPEKWRGQSLTNAPIVKLIMKEREGVAEAVGPDGVLRLYAFTPLGEANKANFATVGMGVPTAVAYADANRLLFHNLSLLGVAAALALAAAWFVAEVFILRRVNSLVRVARRLEDGDLSARTDLGYGQAELGQLAHAFDQMASTLQQRRAERDLAEEALYNLNQELERRVAERTRQLREKNEQMEADLAMAREFQIAFLPRKFPTFPPGVRSEESALRFVHCYRPSGAVGGDFYDILRLSDTEAGLFMCDVMGHGVRAALVTAIIRGLVEELKLRAGQPGPFLTEINRALAVVLHETDTTVFASAHYMIADVGAARLRYANAGHPNPIHLCRSLGTAAPLPCPRGGGVLGLFPENEYQTIESPLAAGDVLVLYTDGVFEIPNPAGEEYGQDRFAQAVRNRLRLRPEQLFAEVLEEIEQFAETDQFPDDVCLVAMEVARIDGDEAEPSKTE